MATHTDNASRPDLKEEKLAIVHSSLTLQVDYESFTKTLEDSLGWFKVPSPRSETVAEFENAMAKIAGDYDLMLFGRFLHGEILSFHGQDVKLKAYLIGNAATALKMTKHDFRAALYAPLRMIVFESGPGETQVEFDKPSSLFGNFNNREIDQVAEALDQTLIRVLNRIALEAKARRNAA